MSTTSSYPAGTSSLSAGRRRGDRDRAVVFGIAMAWLLFAGLFPWFPGTARLNEGATAPTRLVAPRSVSYVSEVLTQQRRREAAAAVRDVLVFDQGVHTRQIADLDRRIDRMQVARRDVTLSTSARESAVRAVGDGAIGSAGAVALASASDAQWSLISEQARSALARVLAGALGPGDIESARQRVGGLLSPDLTADQAEGVRELVGLLITPTLVVDLERTAAQRNDAMASQPPVRVSVEEGDEVLQAGQILNTSDVERLDQLGLRSNGLRPAQVAAAALFAVLGGAAWGGYFAVFRPAALGSRRRLVLAALLVALPLLGAKLALPHVLPDAEHLSLVAVLPLAAGPMTAAVLLDVPTALLVAVTIALGSGIVVDYLPPVNGPVQRFDALRVVVLTAATCVSGLLVAADSNRLQRFLVAGIASAGSGAAVLTGFWLLDADRAFRGLVFSSGSALGGGVLSAVVATGVYVLLSRPFGIVTRIELMELAQLSHPLLRRLQDEAPGTFQHAILVGNLAERAADRIGADALLVRVGAYYHDVGKLVAPSFFVENAHPDANPHEGLDPLQSTRVIHQHVTAGIELARREGLPAAVTQFIPEHHGTRLMTFFYRRAAESDPQIDAELFRYPGPKPRSRESALVMLADACEATARASADRSPDRIRSIVEGVIRERIEEYQFDECDISLRDLAVVAQSFTNSLSAVYHPRVEYPEPTAREVAARRVPPPPPPPSARLASGVIASTAAPPAPAETVPGAPTLSVPAPVPRNPDALSENDT